MIYKIYSMSGMSGMSEITRFTNRIDAIAYMNFNDTEREDLFYIVEKQINDFILYHWVMRKLYVISKIGMIHCL